MRRVGDSEAQRKIIDYLGKTLASAIAKDVGVSEVDSLTSVIELHEHGYLKIPMTDGKVGAVYTWCSTAC